MRNEFVRSNDGTNINYKVLGEGPGILVVHGAFRGAKHYLAMAEHLKDKFTVYIMDRRGRFESGPKGDDYSLKKECEDVLSILKKHDIKYLFGHSFGALVSLNVALEYKLLKLCIYEAPNIDLMDLSWFPKFEEEINKEEFIDASITFIKGMEMLGDMQNIPDDILKMNFTKMAQLKKDQWNENSKLLSTVPIEIRAIMDSDSRNFDKFKNVNVETLILTGAKSPSYLREAQDILQGLIKNSKKTCFEGLSHNGPDEENPEKVGLKLREFF